MTNTNVISQYLGGKPKEFTKQDLIKFIDENKIEMAIR